MTRHYLLITLQLLFVIYIKLLLLLKAIMHASLLLGNGVYNDIISLPNSNEACNVAFNESL